VEQNYVKNFEVFADAWSDRHELVSLADLDKWLNLPKYEHDDLVKRPYFSWIDLAVREGKLNIYRANGVDFDTGKIALLKVFVNRIDNYDVSPIRRVHFIRNEIIPYIDEIKKFLRMYAETFVENVWEYHAQIDNLKAEIEKHTRENDTIKEMQQQLEELQVENSRLRMSLEDEEKKNFGLSDELSTRHAELLFLRQEMEELKAQGSEAFHLRTMWRYILDLERQGKPDDVIKAALIGDGFSGITADALLYDGKGGNMEAVKKWGQRKEK